MTEESKQGWWLWFLLRPQNWFPYLGLTLLGWSGTQGAPDPWITLSWSALYLAGGYGFNGACDWKTDDPAKNPIRAEMVSPRVAGTVSLVLLLAPAPLAWALLPAVRWLALAMVTLGIVYSLPRWGLKRLPGVVSLANLALFVPLYWIGAGRMPVPGGSDLWVLCVLGLPSLQSQLVHELGDDAEDRQAGFRSTAIWLGEATTRRSVQLLGAAVCGIAVLAWREGLLSAWVGVLFGVAGIAGALRPDDSAEASLQWRRRIKFAYLVPCAGWLLEGIFTRLI